MLKGKKILLGICGSIAAYKAAYLTRLLIENGADVQIIMTPFASSFITPLTLSTLSKHSVLTDFTDQNEYAWNSHVSLGLWADLMIIAPATANTLSKMANGSCDNLLLAVYLSAKCPVFIAPAMDVDMWKHPATQNNIDRLKGYGNRVISVATGELASGLIGEGRLAEPEEILENLIIDLKKNFNNQSEKPLINKVALVTAGPTQEPIDPIRYISNNASGKMGIAIAEELAKQGANVVLIKGPSSLSAINPDIQQVDVRTAEEMFNACMQEIDHTDIFVMTAAVADFTPITVAENKLKKEFAEPNVQLKATKDIIKKIGKKINKNQLLVGFALETEHEKENAIKKLKEKNMDFIVLNSLNDEGAGFNYDTNKISIIDKNLTMTTFDKKLKSEVAVDIINKIKEMI